MRKTYLALASVTLVAAACSSSASSSGGTPQAPDGVPSRDAKLGTVRLRWTEPGASQESSLARPMTAHDLAERFSAADPTFRLDAIVAKTAEILHTDDGRATGDLRDVLDVAREDDRLPATDQVHAFREMLEQVVELGP